MKTKEISAPSDFRHIFRVNINETFRGSKDLSVSDSLKKLNERNNFFFDYSSFIS